MLDFVITVSWQLANLTPPPKRWISLPGPTPLGPDEPHDAPIETALSWPPHTLRILRQAFAQHWSRSLGWEIAEGDQALEKAAKTAALYFKRGVASRQAQTPPPPLPPSRSGSYPIRFIDSAIPPLDDLPEKTFFILDANVAKNWALKLPQQQTYTAHLGEKSKTLESLATIVQACRASQHADHLCVIGGGLLADVAAFAAALLSRPIRFIPTTLLAIADACVGGKTGVNFPPFGKNQLGSFYFPEEVRVWSGWLKTLPLAELKAGGSECLKHAFLKGDLALAKAIAQNLTHNTLAELSQLLPDIVRTKVEVIEEDPTETGRRAILNFGHTLGHALEGMAMAADAPSPLLHGEAVSLGMAYALFLSEQEAGLSSQDAAAMRSLLHTSGCLLNASELTARLGMSLRHPQILEKLLDYVAHDKKIAEGTSLSQWVLLSAIGRVAQEEPGCFTKGVSAVNLVAPWQDLVHFLESLG